MIQNLFILSLLITTPGQQELSAISVNDSTRSIELSQHSQIIEDRAGSLNYSEALQSKAWQYLRLDERNRGLTTSTYWIRVSVHNTAKIPLRRHLTIGHESAFDVRLWQLKPNGSHIYTEAGSRFHFEERDSQTSVEAFRVSIAPNEVVTLLIRVQNLRPLDLSTFLIDTQTLMSQERQRALQAGIFVGAMLLLIFYNFALGFRHSSLFLLHGLFSTALLIMFARPNGITWQYLWPAHGELDAKIGPFIASLGFLSGLLFLKNYFDLNNVAPRLSKVILAYAWLPMVILVGLGLEPHQFVASTIVRIIGIGLVLWLSVTLWAVYERLDGAIGYASSWGLILVGAVVYAFWLQGYTSSLVAAGDLVKLAAIGQVAGLSVSARRRLTRSQKLLDETNRAVQAIQKREQVNQLNDIVRTLGHEFANPIGAIHLAQDEIQVRLRKIHRLINTVHEKSHPSPALTELYQELDTLYGLHEASQQSVSRLGRLRSVFDTQIKLNEPKSESICINQLINEALDLFPANTLHLDIKVQLATNLPRVSGFPSHLTHLLGHHIKETVQKCQSIPSGSNEVARKFTLEIKTQMTTRQGKKSIEICFGDNTGRLPTPHETTQITTSPSDDDDLIHELNQLLARLIQESHGISHIATIDSASQECHQKFFLPIHSISASQSSDFRHSDS